jgi:hypothetical protein
VKVFNNILSKHLRSLTRLHGAADRSALPIAGDDDQAKAMVTAFVDSLGYDTVDAGHPALPDEPEPTVSPGVPVSQCRPWSFRASWVRLVTPSLRKILRR